MNNSQSLLVSATEVCRILGISRATLQRLEADGVLERVRVRPGAHPRYRRADILEIVAGAGPAEVP